MFSTIVPRSVRLSEAPSYGQPAIAYDPYARGSKAYIWLAEEFDRRFFGPAPGIGAEAPAQPPPPEEPPADTVEPVSEILPTERETTDEKHGEGAA